MSDSGPSLGTWLLDHPIISIWDLVALRGHNPQGAGSQAGGDGPPVCAGLPLVMGVSDLQSPARP